MLPPRRLGLFTLRAVLIYAVLMAPWPGLERGYAYLFRTAGNVVFARFWFWPEGKVRFLDLHSDDQLSEINAMIRAELPPNVRGELPPGYTPLRAEGVKDTMMVLMNRRAPASIGRIRTSSRLQGYGPTVTLIALVLATPLPWSRRGRALLWGLLLIHVFIALRLTLTLAASGFAVEDKVYALFAPGRFWRGVLTRGQTILSDNPTVSFVVPAFIWFLVALRGIMWAVLDDRNDRRGEAS